MSQQEKRAIVLTTEALQKSDKLSGLRPIVFVASEHVGQHIEDRKAWLKICQVGIQRAVHRRRLDLAFHEGAEDGIFADEIDQPNVG